MSVLLKHITVVQRGAAYPVAGLGLGGPSDDLWKVQYRVGDVKHGLVAWVATENTGRMILLVEELRQSVQSRVEYQRRTHGEWVSDSARADENQDRE